MSIASSKLFLKSSYIFYSQVSPALPTIMRQVSKWKYEPVESTHFNAEDFQSPNRVACLVEREVTPFDLSNLKEDQEDFDEPGGECIVCFAASAEAVLIMCGHSGLCPGSDYHHPEIFLYKFSSLHRQKSRLEWTYMIC